MYAVCTMHSGAYTLVNMNTNSNETLTRQMKKCKRNKNGNSNTIEEEKKTGKKRKRTIAENAKRTNAQIPLRFITAYYIAQNSVHFVCSRFVFVFLSFISDASELISPAPS